MEKVYREIIVYKLYSQPQNESLGFLRIVAEQQGDDYIPLNANNFCYSEKIFVTTDYEEIDRKYQEYELFKIKVSKSNFLSENISPERNCTYVALGTKTKPIKPRELIEVIECSLPDPNEMEVILPYLPSTAYLYLQDEGICYGPFNWKPTGSEGKIAIETIKSPLPGRTLPLGRIFSGKMSELDENHAIHCQLQEHPRVYFKNLADLHNDTLLSSMDYYSDAEIVKNFIKATKEMNLRGNHNQAALNFLLQRVRQNPASKHANQLAHINRISEMANEQELYDEAVMTSFAHFLQTERGQKIVKKYIEDNKVTYLADLRSDYQAQLEVELEENLQELAKIKDELNVKTEQLNQLNAEIEEANQLKVQAQLEENRQLITHLDGEIEEKTAKLVELTTECQILTDKYQQYHSLDDVTTAVAELEENFQQSSQRNQDIEQQIAQIESLYQLSAEKLKSKLIELKPFVEVINGSSSSHQQNTAAQTSDNGLDDNALADERLEDVQLTVTMNDLTSIEELVDSSNTTDKIANSLQDSPKNDEEHNKQLIAHSILQAIKKSFALEQRNLSMLDVINLVVTLQQSFISFLAGLPGGGKTTLARLIAKAQGIQQQRFLEIPISRGWTGQKDLLGFFNPIVNKFQPSSTGLYEFLYALSEESKQTQSTPLSMVLLDEANLSPMEYYWSSFMRLTDSDANACKDIKLENSRLLVPDNLRFVSTINYDSTTEYLSPRMIDRAPIIVLDSNTLAVSDNGIGNSTGNNSINNNVDGLNGISHTTNHLMTNDTATNATGSNDNRSTDSELTDNQSNGILDKPVAYEVMESLFGNASVLPQFTDTEQQLYQKIKTLLEKRDNELGKPILISNRKEVAIRQYCHKARPLMQAFALGSDFGSSSASVSADSVNDYSAELLAMDFAVLQFILPLLKGHGQPFRERLVQLQEILQDYQLQRSSQYLEMMIGNGDADLRTYDFFCW